MQSCPFQIKHDSGSPFNPMSCKLIITSLVSVARSRTINKLLCEDDVGGFEGMPETTYIFPL